MGDITGGFIAWAYNPVIVQGFCFGQDRSEPSRGPKEQVTFGLRERAKLSGTCSAFAHVGGFAAEQEVLAWRSEEIDHLGVFVEPCLVLRTSRNDHEVAWAADPLFAAEAELHLAFKHPHDLLIRVTVRLNMDAGPDAPPYAHPLITGENSAADLFAALFLR